MAQLTRLTSVVTVCFLGTVGVAQVTSSGNAKSGATPPDEEKIILQCDGDSGDHPIKQRPEVVTFTTAASCKLKSLTFDTDAKGFTLIGTNPDASISYKYDGRLIPPPGYRFHYMTTSTKPAAGNGTGVIKN